MEQLSLDDLEIWKPVVGWEDRYKISSLGRVWSIYRPGVGKTGRMRKASFVEGYPALTLTRGAASTTQYVHRLVAAAFIGPCPPGQEVRHLDGNRKNPRLVNLMYGTRRENNLDQVRHGTHPNSRKTHCKRGHRFDEENIAVAPSNPTARYCKACHKEDSREAWRRKAAAKRAQAA